MNWLLDKDFIDVIDKTFTTVEDKFGKMVTIELKPGGADIPDMEENKRVDRVEDAHIFEQEEPASHNAMLHSVARWSLQSCILAVSSSCWARYEWGSVVVNNLETFNIIIVHRCPKRNSPTSWSVCYTLSGGDSASTINALSDGRPSVTSPYTFASTTWKFK
jgi:hypothetical protein